MRRSPVLETLAELYAESTAGQTGCVGRDFSVRFEELLSVARCESGDAYANALADLRAADGAALALAKHPRSGDAQRVKVPLAFETALFERIGRASPTVERDAWAALLQEAAEWPVPAERVEAWTIFCHQRAQLMRRGEGWHPFRRKQRHRARLQLEVVARLLAWDRPALLRTVSARLAGGTHTADPSKFLGRCRGTLETLLAKSTGGEVKNFADLGITDNPRSVTFHGPLRIRLGGATIDYANHIGASSLSEDDLAGAECIECAAPRCVTVENETKFHELARLDCGDLFIFTSYPNWATVEILHRLPATLPRYHFGDTDPWGYDVLRTLRDKLKPIEILPLHMLFRPIADAPALSARDQSKLTRLLTEPLLRDVRSELERMDAAKTKGDFEQETVLVSGPFPYA